MKTTYKLCHSRVFFLILFLFITGCGYDTHTEHTPAATIVTGDEPEVVIEPSGNASDISPLFAMKVDDTLFFSNHSEMTEWKTGNIEKAGVRRFSHEDYLYTLDASGDEIDDDILAVVPTHIADTDAGVFACLEYSAELSYSLGGMARIHTEIYQDNVLISEWYNNQHECHGIISSGTEVFAINQFGSHEQINGVYSAIEHINDDFVIHSWDPDNSRISFNSNVETFGTNHILTAENWQLYDGLYYSENGFTWSETAGLSEGATALQDFTEDPYPVPGLPYGQQPVFLSAGIYNDELYWVECNTGWVFKYNPEIDVLTRSYRIYYGDGLHSTGILMRKVLNPVMIDFKLYFQNDNSVWTLNVVTGLINIFYGSYAEILRYD